MATTSIDKRALRVIAFRGPLLAAALCSSLGLLACGGGGGNSAAPTHVLGGSVSGLNGAGLVLANGSQTTTVASGATTFSLGSVAAGATYAITVAAEPIGISCSVASGSGTMGSVDVNNVVVTCSDKSYSLGGTVSGLSATGLSLTDGTDTVTVASGATVFSMPTPIAYTSSYAVSVKRQPVGEACTASNANGVMPANDVVNVAIVCTPQVSTYTLGGSISGLSTGGLVLANGADTLPVAANATSYSMPTAMTAGSNYAVTVGTQPAGLTCTVANASGTMPASNVSNVAVTCSTTSYTLGGTISGLTLGGLVLANGADTLAVAANATAFTMPAAVAYGSSYTVTVNSQPFGLDCVVANGSGTMPAASVASVQISCAARPLTERVLWSFSGNPDGAHPIAALIQGSDGNLYGTTQQGGTNGNGSVFRMTPVGVMTVLYSMSNTGNDGANPTRLLQGRDGNFFGTTIQGATGNCGTIFKTTPAGTYTVLHAFAGSTGDGCQSGAGLIQGNDGNFYGTTTVAGAHSCGTVFKITPAGSESVLYSFAGGSDGCNPAAELVQGIDGNFYGTTKFGGSAGVGTIFQVTAAGTEKILYTFTGGVDGGRPVSALIQASDGNFYGTSVGVSSGGGTVFRISPAGNYTLLYAFPLSGNGSGPLTLALAPDGNFYGTTSAGGTYNQGTVFKVTAAGAESVLYSLRGGTTDGSLALAGLVVGTDGNLYGTTDLGGTNNLGTAFVVTP